MELEKIDRLKELIKQRDALTNDLSKLDTSLNISPSKIVFEWDSGFLISIDIPFGKSAKIRDFLKEMFRKELNDVENRILSL